MPADAAGTGGPTAASGTAADGATGDGTAADGTASGGTAPGGGTGLADAAPPPFPLASKGVPDDTAMGSSEPCEFGGLGGGGGLEPAGAGAVGVMRDRPDDDIPAGVAGRNHLVMRPEGGGTPAPAVF